VNDVTSVVEAAYALIDDDQAWLTQLAETAYKQLDQGAGLIACVYDATAPDTVEIKAVVAPGVDLSFASSYFQPGDLPESEARSLVRVFRRHQVGTVCTTITGLGSSLKQYYASLLEGAGLRDVLFVNATDPSRMSCAFGVPGLRQRWSPRTAQRWRRVAAHLASAMRIRRQLCRVERLGAPTEAPSVEAILSPSGTIEHALDHAKGGTARAALRRAAVAFDRARGPLRRENQDEALAIWHALIEGRWSLLDHFDSDGRRFIVAHRNDPNLPDVRGLTRRECQVLAYAMLGRANKDIAYELGIATATVGVHLARARRKLGDKAWSALGPALALAP
jgi:hypothetical protein